MTDEQYTWEDLTKDEEFEQFEQEEHIKWDSLNKDNFCKTLLEYYQHQQDDFAQYNFKELFNRYNNLIKYCSKQSQKVYEKLPNKITIYRGGYKSEKNHGFGISWTLSKQIALYFAFDRYANIDKENRTVFEKEISKNEIKAIITEMDEQEVIVTNIK